MKPDIATYLEHNEVGDAELFVELFTPDYLYDRYTRTWYKWEGHYWREEGGEGVLSAIDEVVRVYEKESKSAPFYLQAPFKKRITALNTYQRRANVLKLAAARFSRNVEVRWDAHPWRMPCENGVINLKTGELMGGKQEDYQRSFCPTTYRGARVPCPRWDQFMLEIMDGDKTMVAYLRRLVGYALSGTASEGVFPVMWGRGRNGKGTMLEVLGKVLGDFATPVSSSLLMEQTYTRNSAAASPDLMKLQGKRLVWANETDEGKKLSTALVKWLVGGDTITARPLYGKEDITFHPTHTMFLLTNHKPEINAGDYALWQRLHLIPFNMSFVEAPTQPHERRRDPDLLRRFTKVEDQGILAWAVRGCLEWQEHGLIPPRAVKATTQEYVEEEDYLKDFLSEETTPGEEWNRAFDVYQRYRGWALDRGMVVKSMTAFGNDITRKVNKRRGKTGKEYQVGLRPKKVYG